MYKEHYYRRFEKIYWLKPGRDLDLGLRELEKDAHVVEMLDENSDSGEQSQKPVDVPDHTPMASPESAVSTLVPAPMPSSEMPYVPAPMESPLPTPIVSPFPSPIASPIPTHVPSPVPSPVPHLSTHPCLHLNQILVMTMKVLRTVFIDPPCMRKKGKNVCGSGSGGTSDRAEIHHNEGDDISEEDELVVGGTVGHKQTYTQGMPSEPQGGPQLHECGHSNHNIRKCTNIGVPQKPRDWVPPATAEQETVNNDPQAGPDEVDLSQGVPTADPPESQPNNAQPRNVESHTSEVATAIVQPTITVTAFPNLKHHGGHTATRPPIRGRNFKNPPYRPPGTVPGDLRRKMNTVRPPIVTHTSPPKAAHHNSTTPQLQLQPSNETIQAASQGTRARFMQFIPIPRRPPPPGHSAAGGPPTGTPK
ncbi:putative Polycomb group protein ASXL2 isoform X1 [Sesbania bispinosa]|nr:putative Polycomb group protein ASXL2 isoform X1 [Sesbania bispinosa]